MKLYGLTGYPLGHSFSKKYFTEKFEKEMLGDCFFELFSLDDINRFPELIDTHQNLKGLAVTIPHKQAVMPFLSELDETAREVGAVNCIRVSNNKLTGYNTDATGFEKSFKPLLQAHHKKALVLGTGGASKAVQYVLKRLSMPFTLVSRLCQPGDNCISYTSLNKEIMEENLVIINCTPVGMTPHEDGLPTIPFDFLSPRHYLYDLIYKPAETGFLKEGKQRGCLTKNGFEMLILQAEENWRIWNAG
ncbi:MAG: shikimate dehydrogenase [Ferruginibacter sp.]